MSSRPVVQFLAAAGLVVAAGALWASVSGGDGDAEPYVQVLDGGPATVLPTTSLVARPLPTELEVVDLGGTAVRLGDLLGTPLVLNVWATSCPPCRREMPALQQVSVELAGRVRILGLDPEDDVEVLQAFVDEVGVGYEQFRDPGGAVIDALGVLAMPTTLMVRADGTIVDIHLGAFTVEGLRAAIADDLGVVAP